AALMTATATPQYLATLQLFVSTPGGSASDLVQGSSFTQRQVATYADLMTTPVVLSEVVRTQDIDVTPRELAQRVSATVPPNTVLIGIAVTDEDAQQAATLANAIGERFTTVVQELESVDGVSPVKATVVQPAAIPGSPISPVPARNIGIALVLGLFL